MKQSNSRIENFRVRLGVYGSDASYGNNGHFNITLKSQKKCFAIASDGMGWEHVSVSMPNRSLTWDEMCEIKDLFWEKDEWVVQYHPAESEYVKNHPTCLHLWKPIEAVMPTPLKIMVRQSHERCNVL